MGVKTGRDENQIRLEGAKARKDLRLINFAKLFLASTRLERDVEHIVMLASIRGIACAGIERHFVRRDEQNPWILLHEILRSIAVVDIEVDDGNPFETVMIESVHCADSDIAKETKSHRRFALGMVARRANGSKGVLDCSTQNQIDGLHHGTCGAIGGGQRSGRHECIGIKRGDPAFRRAAPEIVDMRLGMDAQNIAISSHWSRKPLEWDALERTKHGIKPRHLFRVAGWRDMAETIRMCDQCGCHGALEQKS